MFALIDLLGGRAQTLRIEVPVRTVSAPSFVSRSMASRSGHQAKRQRAAGPWTVNALVTEGVLQPWQPDLVRGKRCVFVCSTGAEELRELTDRAKPAHSWHEFEAVSRPKGAHEL